MWSNPPTAYEQFGTAKSAEAFAETGLATKRGACYGDPRPDDWFPDTVQYAAKRDVNPRRAMELCGVCPIKADCLEAALAQGMQAQWGIWGGTTAEQRRCEIRNRARRKSKGVAA